MHLCQSYICGSKFIAALELNLFLLLPARWQMGFPIGHTVIGRVVEYITTEGERRSGRVVAAYRGGYTLEVNGRFVDVSDTNTQDADASDADVSCSLAQCPRHPPNPKELSYYRDYPGETKHFWIQVLNVCFVDRKERVFAFVCRADPEDPCTCDIFDRRSECSDVPPGSKAKYVQIENEGRHGPRQIADFQLHYEDEFKRLSRVAFVDLPQFIREIKTFDRQLFDYLCSTARSDECMREVLYDSEAFPGEATSHRRLVRWSMCSMLSRIMQSCEWCRRGCYEKLSDKMAKATYPTIEAPLVMQKKRKADQHQQDSTESATLSAVQSATHTSVTL